MTRIMTTEEYAARQLLYGRKQAEKELSIPAQVKQVAKPVKSVKRKHGNQKVEVDGVKFDSKREANRWRELKILADAGKITDLRRQVVFELVPSVVLAGRKKPPVRYLADFCYVQNGINVIEDCKSPHLRKNPVFRMKQHLLKYSTNMEILLT